MTIILFRHSQKWTLFQPFSSDLLNSTGTLVIWNLYLYVSHIYCVQMMLIHKETSIIFILSAWFWVFPTFILMFIQFTLFWGFRRLLGSSFPFTNNSLYICLSLSLFLFLSYLFADSKLQSLIFGFPVSLFLNLESE